MSKPPVISKATFRGTLLVFTLLALVFVLPDVLMSFSSPPSVQLSQLPLEYQQKIRRSRRNYESHYTNYSRGSRYHAPPAKFDPNTYTAEDWMALGLSEKQAASTLKFLSHGAYSVSDIERIFVIPDPVFELIKDSMYFPEKPAKASFETEKKTFEVKRQAVDLNKATEEELMEVKGIGPFFAKQIVKTREKLGGFVGVEQLMDVWKMDDEKYAAIVPNVIVNPAAVRKININTATAEELKSHPYFSWNLANSIVKLRTQNGPFKSVAGIRKSALMTDELYRKIEPYLTTEE